MKVRHRKGVAIHPDPESCGVIREDVIEALTGESAGQPLSREIRSSGAPTLLSEAEGNTDEGAMRVLGGPCAVEDPEHAQKLSAQELGDLVSVH